MEDLDSFEIPSRSEQLPEVQLFLEKYPNAEISLDHERGQVKYVEEKTVKTRYGDEDRRFYLQIQFNVLGIPSPYVIGCSGNNAGVAGIDDMMDQIQSDWCFKGNLISIED
ncbi:hypothetical protein [Nitrosopumilus ureiphilus]|uniref:hypothetical protein n=1 Tax=Nitrosopumilus ureiphilus TaxID=1470067 RepID=UPI0015C94E61|nr:hypothetical protein [Nitrosopumilus ureiphilus]